MTKPARSKHGLDRKYKPWRKGKSSAEKVKTRDINNNDDDDGDGNNRSRTTNRSSHTNNNASLKNMLRSQKRLLDKLQRGGKGGGEEEAIIDATQKKIHQLEQDIRAHEAKEREKKNAVKYHQVKFIERQKVTRLEKSIKRQLQQLLIVQKQQQEQQQQQCHDSGNVKLSASTTAAAAAAASMIEQREQTQQQISHLQLQLQSIAMDQLYIAFFPTNMKYMALFTHGMNRVVDDERGQKRRKAAWDVIREGLQAEQKKGQQDKQEEEKHQQGQIQSTKSDNGSSSSSDGSSGENDCDSSSVSIDDSDSEPETESRKKDSKDADESMTESSNKLPLKNAKSWVNLDEAKRALLSMPTDTYPNAPSIRELDVAMPTTSGSTLPKNQQKNSVPKNKNNHKRSSASTDLNSNKGGKDAAEASDSRFELSKRLNSLFQESTTGNDYQEKLSVKQKEDSGVSGDESTSNSSDNESEDRPLSDNDKDDYDDDSADRLKESDRKEKEKSSSSTSSTSSSSSSTVDSSDSDDKSDSDSDTKQIPVKGKKNNQVLKCKEERRNAAVEEYDHSTGSDDKIYGDDGDDDFFTTENVSTEDVFDRLQNEKRTNHISGRGRYNDVDGIINRSKRPDKSRGFKSQNQSKSEYRSFQHRQKRNKIG